MIEKANGDTLKWMEHLEGASEEEDSGRCWSFAKHMLSPGVDLVTPNPRPKAFIYRQKDQQRVEDKVIQKEIIEQLKQVCRGEFGGRTKIDVPLRSHHTGMKGLEVSSYRSVSLI